MLLLPDFFSSPLALEDQFKFPNFLNNLLSCSLHMFDQGLNLNSSVWRSVAVKFFIHVIHIKYIFSC